MITWLTYQFLRSFETTVVVTEMHNGSNYKFEDTVQCSFYSTKQLCSDDWDKLCDSMNNLISSLSKDYIWHRDEFKVTLPIFSDMKNGNYPDYFL